MSEIVDVTGFRRLWRHDERLQQLPGSLPALSLQDFDGELLPESLWTLHSAVQGSSSEVSSSALSPFPVFCSSCPQFFDDGFCNDTMYTMEERKYLCGATCLMCWSFIFFWFYLYINCSHLPERQAQNKKSLYFYGKAHKGESVGQEIETRITQILQLGGAETVERTQQLPFQGLTKKAIRFRKVGILCWSCEIEVSKSLCKHPSFSEKLLSEY